MKTINKKHIIAFVFIVVILLILFYYVFQTLTGKERNLVQFILINLLPCVFITVINFLIVHTIYKYFKTRNIYLHVTLDLLISSVLSVLMVFLLNFIFSGFSTFNSNPEILKSIIFIILWNSIVVLLIEIFFYSQRQIDAEKTIAIIEKEKIQYQYETLKAQINPHFLFNSLNVLSSLAYEDAEKANLFSKKMSSVYRYVLLTSERLTVTLKEELAFLDAYVFLEKIRFGDNLQISLVNQANLSKEVIPVSLQLLVENAVKHNIATLNQPLTVKIEITGNEITVSNNLQPRTCVEGGGMGLINLQKQYALYNKTIDILKTETQFIVKLPFLD
ncbi:histidine kinase [Pedobacter gandavensis]|uniref:sensor histidine kinase n=1 Tax=Pedobacter gandavensis TaxID=2679963 RepID=UPI00292DB08E|nr:histidine kinase [Pedobacter gandavensis]